MLDGNFQSHVVGWSIMGCFDSFLDYRRCWSVDPFLRRQVQFIFVEIDQSIFSYYIDGESVPSIQFVTYMLAGAGFNDQTAPWGTKWIGKGAKSGGWYNNL